MSDMNQKDLVLSINEYAYVLDETKGHVSCLVGPMKMSLSQSDKLVRFNPRSKSFEPCNYNVAKYLFTTIPENWYAILKNPVADNKHPTCGMSNSLPENIHIGQKINVRGPASFALYPGQMTKVIRGHALRSNQYLLARVYEASAANSSQGEIRDAKGNLVETSNNYVNGQILVIKGTEISFYIPPTGIEVIPINNEDCNGYVRDAVTLERLEYCILKDEDGNKRYVHGPDVVFPKPTENFVVSHKGGYVFRAIELSKISGIYVKVIAEYKEGDVVHPIGEELFITGDDQMIYYPRPEHAIISYDEKIVHHAIAIPEGEGRYVMNRMTGEIKTVKGPAMYLPDPRTEVIVKRKLSEKQCDLWYPGNSEVLLYNAGLTEKSVEKSLHKSAKADGMMSVNSVFSFSETTLDDLETNSSIARGTSYTKPRTITLDNKYEGVVAIDVWTGYAVNVVSKNGGRKVVCGPQTVLLDYDQTLEVLGLSTGNPKTTDRLDKTVYLQYTNNKISDMINVETKDYVNAVIKVSYCVDFDKKDMAKWFNIENYVKYLCDRVRSLLKREAKKYSIEEFYQNYSDIVRAIAIDKNNDADKGRYFAENGMIIRDCEVLSISIDSDIEEMILSHQKDIIEQNLRLAAADSRIEVAHRLALVEQEEQKVRTEQVINKMNLQEMEALRKMEIKSQVARREEAEREAAKQAEENLQPLLDKIAEAELARDQAKEDALHAAKQANIDLEIAREAAYAQAVVTMLNAVQPGLIEALNSEANANILESISNGMAPYALARGQSISEFCNELLRGTTLEEIVKDYKFKA